MNVNGDTLRLLRGHDGKTPVSRKADEEEFLEGIRSICDEGARHDMPNGRVLMLINKNFGYQFDTIPFCRLIEMEDFIRNCWFRETEITSPDLHKKLLESENDYSKWFRLCAAVRFEEAKQFD
jgi:hypothetical protein